jgi:hypothetical protein
MKRFMALMMVAGLLAVAVAVHAQNKPAAAPAKPAMTKPAAAAAATAPSTLKGEVVDTGCYISHEAKGEKHVSCANKCIAAGMPMGLLTADGKLYLITRDHEMTDPYEQAKTMAGSIVEATGVLAERGGMRSIDLTGIKLAAK